MRGLKNGIDGSTFPAYLYLICQSEGFVDTEAAAVGLGGASKADFIDVFVLSLIFSKH